MSQETSLPSYNDPTNAACPGEAGGAATFVATKSEEESRRRGKWWPRRSVIELILAIALLVFFYFTQVLWPPEYTLYLTRRAARTKGVIDIDAPNASEFIGQVHWQKCQGIDVLPGTECGHIMYVSLL